ncbi:MAG: hypothetical protein U0414_44375 [Polyangiaceae bacterium]
MTSRARLVCLAFLALSGAFVGVWAGLLPRSFYDGFPGFGRKWVSGDGPFNEHLVRDVGGFYLALTVLAVLGLVRRDRATTRIVGAVWTTFSVPHLAYHAHHLGAYELIDQIGNMVALGGTLLASLFLMVPERSRAT